MGHSMKAVARSIERLLYILHPVQNPVPLALHSWPFTINFVYYTTPTNTLATSIVNCYTSPKLDQGLNRLVHVGNPFLTMTFDLPCL